MYLSSVQKRREGVTFSGIGPPSLVTRFKKILRFCYDICGATEFNMSKYLLFQWLVASLISGSWGFKRYIGILGI